MGFLKNLFGNEKSKEPIKEMPKAYESKRNLQTKEAKNKKESNEFLNQLDLIIEQAKEMVSISPKTDIIQEKAISIVLSFFYSNVISNFKNNLTKENLKEFNIPEGDVKNIEKEFKEIFKKCEKELDEEEIDSKFYHYFRNKLEDISKNAYKLLLDLEKYIDMDSCEKNIAKFRKEVETLGKELKIGRMESEDGSMGISIGFENGDGEDYENEEKEITNFNKFSLDIDEEWLTLEDEQGGYFFGRHYFSKNKIYLVSFCDGHEESSNEKSKWVSGQVYLIKNKNKILWKKEIARPEQAFVNDNGIVIVIDWTSYKTLSGKIYFFNEKGKKLFEHEFNCNIGGQSLSDNEEELIISTCFPENSIYLFDITNQKLIKKVKNTTSQKPLINFNFKDIRKLF